jgi:uncharacterized membrane protein SpoIIM required for sporulation
MLSHTHNIKMNSFGLTLTALCCIVVVLGGLPFSSDAQLDPSFYKNTCPKVHSIVREVIRNVSKTDPRMLASLVRLHFHDCFVLVCVYNNILCIFILSPSLVCITNILDRRYVQSDNNTILTLTHY